MARGEFVFVAEDGVEGVADGFAAQVRGADEIGRDDVALQGAVQPLSPAAAFLGVVRMTVADEGGVAAGVHRVGLNMKLLPGLYDLLLFDNRGAVGTE